MALSAREAVRSMLKRPGMPGGCGETCESVRPGSRKRTRSREQRCSVRGSLAGGRLDRGRQDKGRLDGRDPWEVNLIRGGKSRAAAQ